MSNASLKPSTNKPNHRDDRSDWLDRYVRPTGGDTC